MACAFIQSKEQYSTIVGHLDSSMGMSRKAAMRRICPGMSRFRFAKCTNMTFGKVRIAHQVRTFSQNDQNG